MDYNQYMQNLTKGLTLDSNMLSRSPVPTTPDISALQQQVANMKSVNQGYQAPTLSDLNAVREKAYADYAASQVANQMAPNNAEARQAIISSLGSDAGFQQQAGSGNFNWGDPFAGGVTATSSPGLLGGLANTYSLGLGVIAQALGLTPTQNPANVPVVDMTNPSGGEWGGYGAGNGGFSYGDSSDSGYASDAGYSGGGGWSSSDYGGGWSGY